MSASVTSFWQHPRCGQFDLVTALTQFRRNPGQADGGVDLGPPSRPATRRAGRPLPSAGQPKHAVFVDRQALVAGPPPQADVVLLGAGEVLECRPERLGRRPPADRPARPAARGCSSWSRPAASTSAVSGQSTSRCMTGHGRLALDEDVEIADGFAAPAQASGSFDPAGRRACPRARRSAAGRSASASFQSSRARSGSRAKARFSRIAGLGLRPEALDAPDPPLAAGVLESRQRVDAEGVDQRLDLLGPEPGHPHQVEDHRRHLLLELLEQGQPAGVEQRLDLAGQVARRSPRDRSATGLGIGPHAGQRLDKARRSVRAAFR